ncbi:MAG TPA: carboxypeptidase-like regulatory domain-containing protein [Candidatus Angelobacter sp.]
MNTIAKKILALMMVFSLYAMGEEKNALPLPTSGSVTLTLNEYNRLIELAAKAGKKSEAPPLPYAIKRADMKLRVAGQTVLGTVQLDGEVFSKAAAKVPLTNGLTILNARQEGKNLPLEDEGTTSTAILPGAAEFSVALDTGLQLAIDAGRAYFNFPVPAAGSVRLSLAIPGDHSFVLISPGLITSRTAEKNQTTVEATLVPGQPVTVWWATGEIQVPVVKHEARFLSDVKTLITVNDQEIRVAALTDINVLQGEPAQFIVDLPEGYEITEVSGSTVESSEVQKGKLMVRLNSYSPRSHEFLISMERPLTDTKADAPFLSFEGAQRETGEVLVEGTGAMELKATESGSLKRMDIKEVNPYLRSLSRFPLQAAFRYHRQQTEAPKLALEWTRFPDSNVLAAVAEHATVTTLVTVEGRTLTEVKLLVKNQAQPFLKINLPAGASIVSAEVAGERVKPVQGPDGNRVPLLRPGFRPTGTYEVSFVFMHAGAPFARKGGSELALPSMDVPVSLLEWELFLPEQYKVKDFGGDAITANLLPPAMTDEEVTGFVSSGGITQPIYGHKNITKSGTNQDYAYIDKESFNLNSLLGGQIGGLVLDPQGAVIPGAQVTVTNVDQGQTRTAITDGAGHWLVSSVPSGRVKIEVKSQGFKTYVQNNIPYESNQPFRLSSRLNVAGVNETIEVTTTAPLLSDREFVKDDRDAKKQPMNQWNSNGASSNVLDLQKRVAGVLPVRIDVPRAGNSYRFARALVLDEETKVTFSYKTK